MKQHNFPDEMYKEHILELYKNPENFGILEDSTHERTETNSLCGDEITVQLNVKDGKVKDAKFQGSGCVMSIVSASLLINKIREMKIEDIKKLNKEDVVKLLKIKISPARIKCVLLPLNAIKNSLK
ncbi:MAG: iron-sulfur cluster assembly scaffold protein [archaeon]